MSFSIRSGCQNDKSLFNKSKFGQTSHTKIPHGHYFLGDAGYQLFRHIMTPFSIVPDMDPKESHYNYLHSRTRIVVEMAFGLFKQRFQCFKVPMTQNDPIDMANLISAAIILHNWFIDLNDVPEPMQHQDWMHIGGDTSLSQDQYKIGGNDAKHARNMLKEYLFSTK
jgi:hypothetical protein